MVLTTATGIALVVLLFMSPLSPLGYYRMTVRREFHRPSEGRGLLLAETFDYGTVFNISRFRRFGDGSTDEAWANFIDKETISWYQRMVDSHRYRLTFHSVSLEYRATVRTLPVAIIQHNGQDSLRITDANDRQIADRTVYLTPPPYFVGAAFWDGTGYELRGTAFSVRFSNVFLVEMWLTFSDAYGNVCCYSVSTYQLLVIDAEMRPLLIMLKPPAPIAY